ncbi:MAG: tyrosine-type recombinase/integrase [Synergistaceae bacterium]|nr:tyrosine-type recombinase/integrase [Synergistaceae bacterium]
MALTELGIKSAKPRDKEYMLGDGHGLWLLVKPDGKKYWRLRYWIGDKERKISLGVYPTVGLKDARAKRDELFKVREKGADPVEVLNAQKEDDICTFKHIAEEWLQKHMADKKESYIKSVKLRLNNYILPEFKDMPIKEITSGMVLKLCRKIEARGIVETAARVRSVIGQVFRYAIATDRADYDPTAALKGALQTRRVKHMAAITKPSEIAVLMKNINNYPRFIVRCALKFSALVFCRPGEIRQAEWSEIDFDNAEWRIPAEKMKMKRVHIVPLAKQVIELLKELHGLTGRQKYIFSSARSGGRSISADTVRIALRTIGYTKEEMTAHGFRGMASTRLNEMGWPPDVIERQLAHVEQNSVRAAYNHAEYLQERRKMMQAWADYLDGLANS